MDEKTLARLMAIELTLSLIIKARPELELAALFEDMAFRLDAPPVAVSDLIASEMAKHLRAYAQGRPGARWGD